MVVLLLIAAAISYYVLFILYCFITLPIISILLDIPNKSKIFFEKTGLILNCFYAGVMFIIGVSKTISSFGLNIDSASFWSSISLCAIGHVYLANLDHSLGIKSARKDKDE